MSNDPSSPGYTPKYTGAPGNYGTGKEFGADLLDLYKAGQIHIPTTAGHYSEAVTQLHWAHSQLAQVAGLLGHTSADQTKARLEDVRDAMRVTTNRLYRAGTALVAMADQYAKTDEGACTEFNHLKKEQQSEFAHPPGHHPPPSPTDPPGTRPEIPDNDDELDDVLKDAEIEDPKKKSEDD